MKAAGLRFRNEMEVGPGGTPNVHKMHHSPLVNETNSNYANLLTVYDRLLGTFTPAARASAVLRTPSRPT